MRNIEYKCINKELIHSDSVMKRGVLLPVHHGMTKTMFDKLHSTIENFLNQYS